MHFIFSIIIYVDSASYFIEMIMLISLKGILTQTGRAVGRGTVLSKGPMRDHDVVIMAVVTEHSASICLT